jgi:hypothetical protein
MALGDLRLIQDQHHRPAGRRRRLQNLAGEGFHDRVADDQRIAQKPGDPLVTHVGAVSKAWQTGRQIHQVRPAPVEHCRHQQRQFLALRLTLPRKASLEIRADAVRYPSDAVHYAGPGSVEGGSLESHTNSRRQPPAARKLMEGKRRPRSFGHSIDERRG